VIRRVLGVVAYFVVATLVLGYLGVGGYRAGFLWLALALPAAATLLTWLALRAVDTNGVLWCLAVAVVAVTVAAKLVDLAPESTARLDQRLDRLALAFYRPVAEHRSGHGWCRPSCPRVERTYRAPDTAPTGALLLLIVTLSQQGLVPDVRKVASLRPRHDVTIPSHRHVVTARVEPRAGYLEVTVRLQATRPQAVTSARTR
jgi:hypothetical protein